MNKDVMKEITKLTAQDAPNESAKDVMDEFEFRPLSEGLGFYKKPTPAGETSSSRSSDLGRLAGSESLQGQPTIIPPLPRRKPLSGGPFSDSSLPGTLNFPKRPETLEDSPQGSKALFRNKISPDFVEDQGPAEFPFGDQQARSNPALKKGGPEGSTSTNKAQGKLVTHWTRSSLDFSAMFLDGLLVIAFYLLCLIGLIVTTHVDFFASLSHPDEQGLVYISLAALFLCVVWIYQVSTRIFLGFSPGEWVSDLRLGTPDEFNHENYALKVVARATLNVLSGVVVFPLIGLAMRKDVIGRWISLEIKRKTLSYV